MFGGFQSSGFQSGYQIVIAGNVAPIPAYNGNSIEEYKSSAHELARIAKETAFYANKIQETKNEQRAIEYKLDDLEFRRLRDLADEQMQLELLMLLQEQQRLQLLLIQLQQKELMILRDEDDILTILMSLPFYA